MENPYTIRREKNHYYILSEDMCKGSLCEEIQYATLIIINLFYLDDIERYLIYLDRIPMKIQVYLVSSIEELLERAKRYIKLKKLNNVKLIKKENRGRDISALLVTCRKEILNYKYLCFVHDKKANQDYLENDTELWIENLWDNLLPSAEYISNIIDLFENNKEIGLLVPPEPIGEYMQEYYGYTWGRDYENTNVLAKQLGIRCCMDDRIPVITLGTAFWCRTDALKKLFQIKWKYEDFDDEPLPIDGTLSHSIERILSFVAQDAGYDTGTVMCNSYTKRLVMFLQDNMRKAFNVLSYLTFSPRCNVHKMNIINMKFEEIINFCKGNKIVYLYGAGVIGKQCLKFLRVFACEPKGFIVSNNHHCEDVNGLKVINLCQLDNTKDVGIIITVAEKYHEEIINNLGDIGFDNYISYVRTLK